MLTGAFGRLLAAGGQALTGHGLTARSPKPTNAPVALVYRGPATLPGCPEAVRALLKSSQWGFDIRYVGPDEDLPLSQRALAGAALYIQPGGGSLKRGYRHLKGHRDEIRQFVHSGGRYLGICLGGYLAGATPGFALLPGDTDQYITSLGATVDSQKSTVAPVLWRGRRRTLFFQDGPYFWLQPNAEADILATYLNGMTAAMVTGFGAGRVAVVGPHPEATDDWYIDAGLPAADRLGADLGLDLIDAVMRP
ncbi:BPL-N domain-containing protein [Micromonospora sp. GCM10011542]|uniref:BPL-N domain-containing protein n=1 Tax=Micromonospora sp. GCM10011542 TaxID=3317337 RepID=UPI00361870FD